MMHLLTEHYNCYSTPFQTEINKTQQLNKTVNLAGMRSVADPGDSSTLAGEITDSAM